MGAEAVAELEAEAPSNSMHANLPHIQRKIVLCQSMNCSICIVKRKAYIIQKLSVRNSLQERENRRKKEKNCQKEG